MASEEKPAITQGGRAQGGGAVKKNLVGLRGQAETLASPGVAVVDPSDFHVRGGKVRGFLQVEDDEVDKGLERVPVLDGRRVPKRAEEALAEVGEPSGA